MGSFVSTVKKRNTKNISFIALEKQYNASNIPKSNTLCYSETIKIPLKLKQVIECFVLSPASPATPTNSLRKSDGKNTKEGVLALVVEDNSLNQMVVRKQLSRIGISADIAGNGKIGVEMFKQKLYDIVLM